MFSPPILLPGEREAAQQARGLGARLALRRGGAKRVGGESGSVGGWGPSRATFGERQRGERTWAWPDKVLTSSAFLARPTSFTVILPAREKKSAEEGGKPDASVTVCVRARAGLCVAKVEGGMGQTPRKLATYLKISAVLERPSRSNAPTGAAAARRPPGPPPPRPTRLR